MKKLYTIAFLLLSPLAYTTSVWGALGGNYGSDPMNMPRITASDDLQLGVWKGWNDLSLQSNSEGYYSLPNNPFLALDLLVNCYNPSIYFNRDIRRKMVWASDQAVTGADVRKVVFHLNNYNQSIHINTGRHGNSSGGVSYTSTGVFIQQDFNTIRNTPNVSIHILSSYSPKPIYPKGANHVI